MPRRPLALVLLLLAALPASAQRAPALSLEALFASTEFLPEPPGVARWSPDGATLYVVEVDPRTGATHVDAIEAATGARRRLVDGARLRQPDTGLPLRVEDVAFAPDGRRALLYTDAAPVWRLPTQGVYYVLDLASGAVVPLSERARGLQQFAKFDPSGTRVAFVRRRNLYVVDLATGRETALTHDGAEGGLLNGTYDWVYEEEFGLRDGFAWSPDGRFLAFVQLDEAPTPPYPLVDVRPLYPTIRTYPYPKAGQPNARIRVGLVAFGTEGPAPPRFLETGTWDVEHRQAEYLAGMGWTPEPTPRLWMLRLNRDQNDLELLLADPATGRTTVLLRERSDTWIDVEVAYSDPVATFLDDGVHVVWRSDRSGHAHLYLYRLDGTLVRPLTAGDYEVTAFHGLDPATGAVYVTATADGPTERHLYRVAPRPDGTPGMPERLSREAGWHTTTLSPDRQFALVTHSSRRSPPVTRLERVGGDVVTVLQDNAALAARVAALDLPEPAWRTVPGADGTPLHAYVIHPPDFDSTRAHPLLLHVYGGPGVQLARNAWLGTTYLWHHTLARRHGVVVAVVDNRGTPGRGKAFAAAVHRRLGIAEAEDQIAAARHLAAEPGIDPARVGVWGWSYGGYLALMAMLYGEGPNIFRVGMAVAPVTSWRFYDTIYTERYLGTPQNNPRGYDLGSPVTYAHRLRDDQRLLLVHGDADDNVHVQHTVVMADALIAANRLFDLMLYPGRDHGIVGGTTRLHLFTLLTRYVTEHL